MYYTKNIKISYMERRQIFNSICTICYTVLTQEKGILPCGHQDFCIDCLTTWSTISNKCPLCMEEFNLIENSLTQTVRKVFNVNKLAWNENYTDILCEICESGSNENQMLLCDSCDCGFHIYCLNLRRIPNLALWFCSYCIQNTEKSVQIKQKVEIAHCKERDSGMILRHRNNETRLSVRRSSRLSILTDM